MGIFRFGNAEYSTNFFVGSIFMFLSTLCCISAFAAPYWTKRYFDTPQDFRNIGLWELCLYKYRHYKDDLQIPYTGCFWFWTNEMYRFRDWIIPRKVFRKAFFLYSHFSFCLAWFKWVQAFATLAFIFTLATISSLAIAVFSSFRWQWRYQLIWCILSFVICKYSMNILIRFSFILVTFELIAVCVYGVYSQDRLWMPRPEFNYLSYSFWLEVGALFFALCACRFYFGIKKMRLKVCFRWIVCWRNSTSV
jgi:hypothetical protein